jgi:hypothetical protein
MVEGWDFEKRKQYLLKNCNFKGWDGYDADSVKENELNYVIKMANELNDYFNQKSIKIKKPHLFPLSSLEFHSFDFGYSMSIDFYDTDIVAYGRNKCRNWRNTEEREFNISNKPITRRILGLFAKWLKEKKAEWEIEIESSNFFLSKIIFNKKVKDCI